MTPEQLESAKEDARFYLVFQSWPNDAIFGPHVGVASFHFRHLVSWALSGRPPAVVILQDTARHIRSIGNSLPLWLQDYFILASETGASRKRGRNRLDNVVRDFAIATTVEGIAQRYSLPSTRNTSTTTESGCSIVTKALQRLGIHMSEANVNAIWRRMRSWADEMRAETPCFEERERAAIDRLLVKGSVSSS